MMRKAFKRKRRRALRPTVNVTVKGPRLSELLRDPSFLKTFEEFVSAYLLKHQQLGFPGPHLP